MNNFKLSKLFTVFLVLAFISSCKKEAEPTAEATFVGLWNSAEYYVDGVLTDNFDIYGFKYEFFEDGTGTRTLVGFGAQPCTWSYDSLTEKLTIITEEVVINGWTYLGITIVVDIIKLDTSNLWFSYQKNGITIEERYLKSN